MYDVSLATYMAAPLASFEFSALARKSPGWSNPTKRGSRRGLARTRRVPLTKMYCPLRSTTMEDMMFETSKEVLQIHVLHMHAV